MPQYADMMMMLEARERRSHRQNDLRASYPGCTMVCFTMNIAGPILVTAALNLGTIIMELAGLSFLGLGAMPPAAEWGAMMSNGRSMLQTAPWVILAPGMAIFLSVAVFNMLGDKLRDVFDPK